jgi:hypothetical protein
MYRSLQRHAPGTRLWVLCLSRSSCRADGDELAWHHRRAVAGFEAADPKWRRRDARARSNISSRLRRPDAPRDDARGRGRVTISMATCISSPPAPIYDELREASVAIIPHRYAPNIGRLQRFGTYNVAGWANADGCRHRLWQENASGGP